MAQDPSTDSMTHWRLDDEQAAVVAHRGGVLHVVGGPGTGKTSTAVGVVVDRVGRGEVVAEQSLLVAPTRVAAGRLRAEVSRRLGGTTTEPLARTASALAFALLRQAAAVAGAGPPRLLSGSEQDLVLADLLVGHSGAGSQGPAWPESVRGALGTRGFRGQLRDLLMRAVEHGLEPSDLASLGRRHERAEWVAAAAVLQEYDQVTALRSPGAFDPAWICTAAADLLEDDDTARHRGQDRVRLIVIDDAHELTASAARLIRALRGPSTDVVLLGDGDLTVQGFRGADPARFDRLAQSLAGADAVHRIVLRTGHRLPAVLTSMATRVAERIGVTSGVRHRAPDPVHPGGTVEVLTLRSPAQEAAYVADRFRRAHLIDGVPWSQMAIVARARGRHEALRRALAAVGIPVVVPGSGVPLVQEAAVRTLLLAFAVVLRQAQRDALLCSGSEAGDLLTSALGGADPVTMMRLRRSVRLAERASGGDRTADDVLAALLTDADPEPMSPAEHEPLRRLRRVLQAGRLAAARDAHGQWAPSATAEGVLWAIWQASGLSDRWARQALEGGARGARADRDLDAVLVLFAAASDYVERLPGMGPAGFLEQVAAQEVAADTLAARSAPAEAVSVLTPQGAAGRQWDRVAVVGVQEGVWPDLRLRDSLLGAEALVSVLHGLPVRGPAGIRAAQSQVRADETRQFYTAVTRARCSLLVTAVSSTEDQPSAFLDVIDPTEEDRVPVEVPAPLTLRGVVGELRRDLVRAHRQGDRPARDRAATHLARLARAGVPGADPTRWWDSRDLSDSRPLLPDGQVRVSPSRVQTFEECALRWLLSSRGGDTGGQSSARIGTLVHDIVAAHPDGDLELLTGALADRWSELALGDGWVADRERRRAETMLGRYVEYAAAIRSQGFTLVGTEIELAVPVGRALVTGRVDRLERDEDGHLRVVDLKTGSTKPLARDIGRHPQLGVYQVALAERSGSVRQEDSQPAPMPEVAEHGGRPGAAGPGRTAGAALVHLGRAAGPGPSVQQQPPLADDVDPRWAHDLVHRTAEGMAGAQFPATVGSWCRTCPVRFSCPLQPEGRSLR